MDAANYSIDRLQQAERPVAGSRESGEWRAINSVPAQLRRHGLREAHSRPLVCGSTGKVNSLHRVPTWPAFRQYPHIELARTPTAFTALVIDIDGREKVQILCDRIMTGEILKPSWIVMRNASGNVHMTWALDRPVLRGANAKRKPIEFFQWVKAYYMAFCGADPAYGGVITHNPLRSAQKGFFRTTWGRQSPYQLRELAEIIPAGWTPPIIQPEKLVSCSLALFHGLQAWAGRPCNQHLPVLPAAIAANETYAVPLPQYKMHDIAQQIEECRLDWSYYTAEEASEYGRQGGIRSGEARRRRTADRDQAIRLAAETGLSQREVANEFHMSRGAVRNICTRSR